MMNAFKKSFSAGLVAFWALSYALYAQAGPELRSSSTEVMVGETIQVDALSGSSMIPVFAKDWSVSPEFELISSNRSGARIQALSPGSGTVSAKVNLKNLTLRLQIVGPGPELTALAAEPATHPSAPAQPAVVTPTPTPAPATEAATTEPQSGPVADSPIAPGACAQEMAQHKKQIAEDFSAGRYDQARAKLLELKQGWQDNNRWADALLGAIEQLSPVPR